MNIASEYKQYISRKSTNAMIQSKAEDACSYCISCLHVQKDFVLLHDMEDHFVYCYCHYIANTKDPLKPFFYIDIPQSIEHNIGELFRETHLEIEKVNALFYHNGEKYTYDRYYNQFLPEGFVDRLCDAVKVLPSQQRCPIYVSGMLANNYSFLFCLQNKFEGVHKFQKTANATIGSEITPRCYFPTEMKESVTFQEGTSAVKYSFENINGRGIAIPLVDETLDSTFYNDITWRDIASVSDEITGDIAGIPIRYVGLRLIIDCYRNIFLSIKNGEKKYKTILLHNIFNLSIENKDNGNEGRDKRITQPQPSPSSSTTPKKPTQSIQPNTNNPSQKKGVYVIDTNVFIDCPSIINHISNDYSIYIPLKVIEELDKFKESDGSKERDNLSKKANEAIKSITTCRRNKNKDIQIKQSNLNVLSRDLSRVNPDNKIIAIAVEFKKQNPIIISSDQNMGNKAEAFSVPTITLKEYLEQMQKKQ